MALIAGAFVVSGFVLAARKAWNWSGVPAFIASEQRTWLQHFLTYDLVTRNTNVKILADIPDGAEVKLGYEENTLVGLTYKHYFVHFEYDDGHLARAAANASNLRSSSSTSYSSSNSNSSCQSGESSSSNSAGGDPHASRKFEVILQFGAATLSIYDARVAFSSIPKAHWQVEKGRDGPVVASMDNAMRLRIYSVLGMRNYSLCFRNCEHVANYVVRRRWHSSQMNDHGTLKSTFGRYMVGHNVPAVNTAPRDVVMGGYGLREPGEPLRCVYSWNRSLFFRYSHTDVFLDPEEDDTFNVVLIGPTGAGKSRLVNVLFNNEVVDSRGALSSVTRDMLFVRGSYSMGDREMMKVVVVDTVGLCDTEWNEHDVHDMIKSRISRNVHHVDAVVVCLKPTRMSSETIRSVRIMMEWFQYYDKKQRYLNNFIFVITNSDGISESELQVWIDEFRRVLAIKPITNTVTLGEQHEYIRQVLGDKIVCHNICGTAFPQEENLRHNPGLKSNTYKSLMFLHPIVFSRKERQIRVEPHAESTCIIM